MSFADGDIDAILVDEKALAARVAELAAQIQADYQGLDPIIIGVLTGSFVFMADLVRGLDMPLTVEFCVASSYGDGTESCGEVCVNANLKTGLKGRHVVVVEDIVDSGRTLVALMDELRQRGAASVECCCLLSKPSRRVVEVETKYLGFEIPDEFVVGYGLDFAGKYRHLPHVAALRPEAYQ
jgi:hypoxanthine phosphoribosyltransferase